MTTTSNSALKTTLADLATSDYPMFYASNETKRTGTEHATWTMGSRDSLDLDVVLL